MKTELYQLRSDKIVSTTTYIIYVMGTTEQVWNALTDGEKTKKYFFGRRIQSTWNVEDTITYYMDDGTVDVRGVIKEIEPQRKLSFTWVVERIPKLKELPPCLVTYELQQIGESVKLTMTEGHTWDVPEDMLRGGREGWPMILSGLKTLVETGKAMPVEVPGG